MVPSFQLYGLLKKGKKNQHARMTSKRNTDLKPVPEEN